MKRGQDSEYDPIAVQSYKTEIQIVNGHQISKLNIQNTVLKIMVATSPWSRFQNWVAMHNTSLKFSPFIKKKIT